jgi:hypothetical protein
VRASAPDYAMCRARSAVRWSVFRRPSRDEARSPELR